MKLDRIEAASIGYDEDDYGSLCHRNEKQHLVEHMNRIIDNLNTLSTQVDKLQKTVLKLDAMHEHTHEPKLPKKPRVKR